MDQGRSRESEGARGRPKKLYRVRASLVRRNDKSKRCADGHGDDRGIFSKVMLGISLFRQQRYQESETAYLEAIATEEVERGKTGNPENFHAWKGLVDLYEKFDGKVDPYIDAAVKLATLYEAMHVVL